jgi:replicative DNA helicase
MNHVEQRIQPHNIMLEQQVLGAVMARPENMERVTGLLRVEHFFAPEHQRIFGYCQLLFDRDRTVSPVSVSAYISAEEADAWEPIGGRAYIARLCGAATTTAYVREQAQDLIEYWRRREMMAAIDEVYPALHDMALPFEQSANVIEEASATLRIEGQARPTVMSIGDAVSSALNKAEEASRRGTGLVGLSTGLRDLDFKLGGLAAGDMIVIAGRPSMGKSTLALNIARNVAVNGHGVLYVTPEMTCEEFGFRILSDHCFAAGERIEYSDIRKGLTTPAQRAALDRAGDETQSLPFILEESGNITVPMIRGVARKTQRMMERKGTPLSMIVVDHMGLVTVPGAHSEFDKATYVSGQMKQLAKAFGVPVLAVSQLSRQVESRDDKRPHLSDLRQSGAIEQDADVVIFPYRHEYYLERSKPERFTSSAAQADWEAEADIHRNVCEAIIAKQRNGPIGSVRLFCDVAANAFRDMARGGF